MSACPTCHAETRRALGDWPYSAEIGLHPGDFSVTLQRVPILSCDCGESPEIRALEPLHAAIARALCELPLTHASLRCIRRSLNASSDAAARLMALPADFLERIPLSPPRRVYLYAHHGPAGWRVELGRVAA